MPATFSLSLPHLTFTTGSSVLFSVLLSYSSALFAASASPACGIRDGFERCKNKSQEHWTVAVATLSSSDHDFQYFQNFPNTCRLRGNKAEKKKYFKVRMVPKGITISHRAYFVLSER